MKTVSAFLLVFSITVHGKVTDKEYALMPPLFHLDDFDQCMVLEEDALYCSITAQLAPINPEEPSRVWKIIQEVISTKKNYRHDWLRHGVCVPRSCPELAGNISFYKHNYDLLREDLSICYSEKYSNLGLKSIVTEMHCETQEPFYSIDVYDVVVAVCLIILLLVVAWGTFYEGTARYKTKEEYDKITNTSAGKILSCFSIPKNWSSLRKISDRPDAVALRCINAVRFYNMFLVIMAHTCMVAYSGPVINPQFFEKILDDPRNMILVNGSLTNQAFLLMAGWLLSYHFFQTFEEQKEVKFSYIMIAFVNRYIRLTPCLLVVLAFSGTWLYHADRGPVWDKIVGVEYRNCRKNWWTNLLYINNYVDSENMCMQHSWYLATDTQLFLISLIIVTIMWKYQHRIKLIMGTSLFIAILIPALHNYIYDYDIVVRQYPESLYWSLLKVPEWNTMFIAGHNNAGGYVVGLITGYLFYHYRNKTILTKKWHILLWWILTFGLTLGTIYVGIPIYSDSYQHSRILAAIYSAVSRTLYAIGIAVALFGVSQGIGWLVRDVLTWLPMQAFGRLSYSAYIVHCALLRMRAGTIRTANYISQSGLLLQSFSDVALSFIFAVILYLSVEMPVSQLQKLIVPQLKETRTQQKNKNNNNNNTNDGIVENK